MNNSRWAASSSSRCASGGQQPLTQTHGLVCEQGGVHHFELGADEWAEVHVRQHIALQIDARRQLNKFQYRRLRGACELEHAALGDVQHVLATPARFARAEGAVRHLPDKLALAALAVDMQASVFNAELQVAGREGADKNHGLGVLADVDKTTGAGQLGAEFADVEVALGIGLGQPENRHVNAATVIKVKLAGLVNHGLGVDGRAKAQAARRNAANHAGLGGQG
jgi:hypothetical protein